jgi:hypothetical protein
MVGGSTTDGDALTTKPREHAHDQAEDGRTDGEKREEEKEEDERPLGNAHDAVTDGRRPRHAE